MLGPLCLMGWVEIPYTELLLQRVKGGGLFISLGLVWEIQPWVHDTLGLFVLTSSFQSWPDLPVVTVMGREDPECLPGPGVLQQSGKGFLSKMLKRNQMAGQALHSLGLGLNGGPGSSRGAEAPWHHQSSQGTACASTQAQ